MSVTRTARAANYEWLDAIDAINMVDVCELIILSSLERKESRGPFMRRDFPMQDNARWLAANVMVRTDNGHPLRAASVRSAVLQAGLCDPGQSRGGVVSDTLAPRRGAPARPARASRHAAGPQFAACAGRDAHGARAALRCGQLAEFRVPYRKWMRVLDALNWIAENERARPRLSLVLRLENVRHLRRAHERPRGAGVLGGGRARHDDRAAAQPAGDPRPGGRPRARSSGRSRRSSRGSSGRRPMPAFPSRSTTRR